MATADPLELRVRRLALENALAHPGGDMTVFAWGLSFFYGRNVYTAIETKSTPGGMGPYVAF